MIIKQSNFIYRKPIVNMLEAKYLEVKGESFDLVKAKYDEAIIGARYIGDDVLLKNLENEMKIDLES